MSRPSTVGHSHTIVRAVLDQARPWTPFTSQAGFESQTQRIEEARWSHWPLRNLPHPSISRAPPGCMLALTSPSPLSPSEPAIRCGLWPGMALHSTGALCLPPSQLVSDTYPPYPLSGGIWEGAGFLFSWWPCLLFSSEGIF